MGFLAPLGVAGSRGTIVEVFAILAAFDPFALFVRGPDRASSRGAMRGRLGLFALIARALSPLHGR
jgi:hypothetical protein